MADEELKRTNDKVEADRPEARIENGAAMAGRSEVEQELPDWTRQIESTKQPD